MTPQRVGRKITLTVDVYCPNGAVVPVVGPETLSVVREPDVDDVVFGARKEEIALLVEFYLRKGPLMSCKMMGVTKKKKIKGGIAKTNLEVGLASDSL